ncbi:hypothetical protein C1I95_32325 [Micromonospora craterilacus]|uniref:VWA domain-containing protein n=2 Tax=Micromonospora craterilacus TaxID=1655439 RepID=A0A2W2E1U2_9ACTN|nr:hypothetical protein C1I95_32325 [Micromonospora craterilacus]
MYRLAEDVRGGVNSYVEGLAADLERDYRLTVTTFNTGVTVLCNAVALADVPRLTDVNYRPSGYTALLDAVGKTITEFEKATTLGEHDRVLLVVSTDGHENASVEFDRGGIAAMIREREAGGKWSFVFLGAGVDTWRQAEGMGFGRASTVAMASSGPATQASYSGLTTATRSYSRGGTGADTAATLADATGGRTVADPSGGSSPVSRDTGSH